MIHSRDSLEAIRPDEDAVLLAAALGGVQGGEDGCWEGQQAAQAPDEANGDPEGPVRVPRGQGRHDRLVPLKGHRQQSEDRGSYLEC